MAAQQRAFIIVPALILGGALAGGLLGSSGQSRSSTAPGGSSDEEVNASLSQFSKVYDLVEDNSADKVTPDNGIYKGA
ncbi:MAG: S41 family peptidase, partial [Bryobacteraceae bacterium]